jgi:hypothetical protein
LLFQRDEIAEGVNASQDDVVGFTHEENRNRDDQWPRTEKKL